ncbi:BED-type domain-containing protein [Aphis craccivora]|uniref:BED-type domain-containing protein n=1 Tax=Aphis craccivora TaxID=307492 RepID=A0A6G0YHQ7_APHCR|nr:BED-type domain-containing protein [Aphis craccivora]
MFLPSLSKHSQEISGIRVKNKIIDRLAFLSLTRLSESIDYLKLNIPLGVEDLFNYFDDSLTVRLFPAIFPPET